MTAQQSKGELGELARAKIDGLHGCIDAPVDRPEPCVPCGWCAGSSSPTGQLLDEE